jgi:hypothetical protein
MAIFMAIDIIVLFLAGVIGLFYILKKQMQITQRNQDALKIEYELAYQAAMTAEATLAQQADMIATLIQTVNEEKTKTYQMEQSLYQILGGLYNQNTQPKTLQCEVNHLFGDVQTADGAYETEEDMAIRRTEYQHFTTRQGDANSSRIDANATRIEELEARLNDIHSRTEEQKQSLNSVSWNDNELFMRMSDLEEKVNTHEYAIQAESLRCVVPNFEGSKTMEERINDLECMMSVCSGWIQKHK